MLKKLLFITIAGLFIVLFAEYSGFSNSNTPPASRTGAPGESTCQSCHGGAALNNSSATAWLVVGDSVDHYKPDSTYIVTVNIASSDITRTRFGFEATVQDLNGDFAGAFSLVSTANTARPTTKYVSHKNASSNRKWTFKWKAPTDGTGDISFYMSANAANNDQDDIGDYIYTFSNTLTQDSVPHKVGIASYRHTDLMKIQNPVSNNLIFNYQASEETELSLVSIRGEKVFSKMLNASSPDQHQISLDRNKINTGVYFVRLINSRESISRKVFVN